MNESLYPVRYRIQFIEPGICSYEDVDDGKVLVSRDALDRMKGSYIGKPVVLCADGIHKNLTAEEAFKLSDEELESLADGIIYNCGWLENGWQFADCIIWDLETKEKIKNGFSASCAYIPTEQKDGGTWHAMIYDAEVANGVYTHMAIVPNPRYEGAKIWELPAEYQNSLSEKMMKIYQNSKESKKMIFKFFSKEKKNAVDPAPVVQEEKMNIDESYIEIDGKQVPMAELIKAYQAELAEKEAMAQTASKNAIKPEDEVDIGDGKKIKAQELVDCYQKAQSKTNAAEETSEEKAAKEKKASEEKKVAEEKKNAAFKQLDNTMKQGGKDEFKIVISTEKNRLDEGSKRYGSNKGGK